MVQLLDQCPEVLHSIISYTNPGDLASLSKSCHFLNEFIKNDGLLWKVLYLNLFDSPREEGEDTVTDSSWRTNLMKVVSFQKLLVSQNRSVKMQNEELQQTCSTVFELLLNSVSDPIKNTEFLADLFSSEYNISAFLCRSSLFAHCRLSGDVPAANEELRQLSAKLHVFYGLEVEPPLNSSCADSPISVHPFARSRVYDLRRYTENNLWGPFMDDGSHRTDWEKIQAIMIDLSYNLRLYTERSSSNSDSSTNNGHLWDQAFHGVAPGSFLSYPLAGSIAPPLDVNLTAQDPYGVTGTWMRIVCFLDYNDFYAFNFEGERIPMTEEREAISTREAFRLIRLQLRVTKVEKPGEKDAKDMPVVHFTGTSKSTYMAWDPNANSKIRGTVRTTPSGDIRWTTFSIFHGEERWRSEGVQVGGIRSARGILGNWFDKDYNPQGPAGPTAFWKISDDIVEDKKPAFSPWQEIINVVFEQ